MYRPRLAIDLNFSALDNSLPCPPPPPSNTSRVVQAHLSKRGVGLTTAKNVITVQHKLPKIKIIFIAENYAIYEGIKLENTINSNDILIISDSLGSYSKNEISQNIQTKQIQII